MSLLRYIGCTGHAHEVASLVGDEIAIRAQTLVHDAANPREVIRDVIAFATAGRSEEDRAEILTLIQTSAPQWATHNFKSGCEVAEMLLHRLAFGPACANRWPSRSSAGTATAIPHTRRASPSRCRCASSI